MEVKKFQTVIEPKNKLLDLKLKEVWDYRDLVMLFVRRTFVAQYKQTILGPAWAIIQPLFTTVIFTFVFGNLAGLAPSGVPTFIFYLCGSIAWTYFSGCLTATSTTFTANSSIMGKVYFPRLVMPISTVISQLIAFAIEDVRAFMNLPLKNKVCFTYEDVPGTIYVPELRGFVGDEQPVVEKYFDEVQLINSL